MSKTFTVKFNYKGKTKISDGLSYSTTASELLDEARKNFKVKQGYVLHILCKGKKIAFEELEGDEIIAYAHPAFHPSMNCEWGCTVTVVGTNPAKAKLKPPKDPNKFCDKGIWGTYDGDLDSKGLRHGKGKITCEDGEVYDGEWVNDRREGRGICRMANGAVYEGDFKRGMRDGSGTYFCANGDRYVGEYRNNLREGRGTYYYPREGSWFQGRYKTGTPDGLGAFYWKDGSVDVGRYKGENTVVCAVGHGVRWSADRDAAWSLNNGKKMVEITLDQARERAMNLGFDGVPP